MGAYFLSIVSSKTGRVMLLAKWFCAARSAERAAALREEVSRNKVAMLNTEADEDVADKFRVSFTR
jgi:hypothetical protein